MSNEVPRVPYVYQPGRPFGSQPAAEQRIYAVGGPGTDHLEGKRFTKAEAEDVIDSLVLKGVGLFDSFLG